MRGEFREVTMAKFACHGFSGTRVPACLFCYANIAIRETSLSANKTRGRYIPATIKSSSRKIYLSIWIGASERISLCFLDGL